MGDDETWKQANCGKQDPRTESKLIQAEFKSETLFLYWFIMRIYR